MEFHLIAKREWTSKYRGVVTKPSQSAVSKPSSLDKARNTREQHQTSKSTPPDVNQEKDKELPSPEEILLTLLVQVDSCSPADLLALTTILPHDSDERKNFDRQETFILGDPAAVSIGLVGIHMNADTMTRIKVSLCGRKYLPTFSETVATWKATTLSMS